MRDCLQAPRPRGHRGNDKAYHYTFCFKTNQALVGDTVFIDDMTVNGVTRDAKPDSVDRRWPGPTATCYYVDAVGFPDSANGTGVLEVHYFAADDPTTRIDAEVPMTLLEDKDLPPCGTGADDGNNPQIPHDADGDATHVPVNCLV